MSFVHTRLMTSSWLMNGSQLVAEEWGIAALVPFVRWWVFRHQYRR